MSQHWPAVAAIMALLVGSMAALSSPVARSMLPAETGRKVLHMEMGLVTLAFPWLFSSAGPVIVLAGVSIAWFAALRVSPRLACAFAAPLVGSGRSSAGEIWFACGVCLTFVCAFDEPLRYCIAILILTAADAAAALVGRRFGRARRMPGGARKSLAGSGAFFLVAFAIAQTGLSFSTAPLEALRAALAVAALATVVEALLGNGLDNLFVPVAVLGALEVCA